MRLSKVLLEATYQADAEARAMANKVWDGVVRYVKSMVKRGKEFHRHPQTKGFAMVGVQGMPSDLGLIIAPKGAQSGIGKTTHSGHKVIVVGGVLMSPFDTTYLDTRIEAGRRTFVHEFTHYLDQQRHKGQSLDDAAKRAADSGQLDAYFRTPSEFNAWYQEIAHAVQDDVERTIRVMTKDDVPDVVKKSFVRNLKRDFSSFPVFLDYANKKKRADEPVAAMKGTKWERKWLKRMHGLYVGLKRRVDDVARTLK